jgi:hypothetical protein
VNVPRFRELKFHGKSEHSCPVLLFLSFLGEIKDNFLLVCSSRMENQAQHGPISALGALIIILYSQSYNMA